MSELQFTRPAAHRDNKSAAGRSRLSLDVVKASLVIRGENAILSLFFRCHSNSYGRGVTSQKVELKKYPMN
eukprot:50439-Prorocentrum_minimum.AAC.3